MKSHTMEREIVTHYRDVEENGKINELYSPWLKLRAESYNNISIFREGINKPSPHFACNPGTAPPDERGKRDGHRKS